MLTNGDCVTLQKQLMLFVACKDNEHLSLIIRLITKKSSTVFLSRLQAWQGLTWADGQRHSSMHKFVSVLRFGGDFVVLGGKSLSSGVDKNIGPAFK